MNLETPRSMQRNGKRVSSIDGYVLPPSILASRFVHLLSTPSFSSPFCLVSFDVIYIFSWSMCECQRERGEEFLVVHLIT